VNARTVVLPDPIIRGSASARCVWDIMRPREPNYEHMFAPGQETLGHYYLPPFQRGACWSDEQSAKLIESIHLGISIGAICVAGSGRTRKEMVDGKLVDRFLESSDWLIDGQQRMRALARYLADDLRIFVGTEHEHSHGDLSETQRRRFDNVPIGFVTLGETSVDELKRIYDLMNFGGKAHEEHERAIPLDAAEARGIS
jgi:hypothetical protein